MFLAVAAALKTIGCTKRNGADIPPTTGLRQQTNAVYYWETAFKLSEQEKDFLQKEKIGRICLRMFDVTPSEYGAVTNASVSFGTTVPSYIEIVPTVFITVDALSRAANTNGNIAHTQRDTKELHAHAIQQHMKYEEKTLFPYVEALLRGEQMQNYNIDIFSKHHGDTTSKLQELKSIIIKYLPYDGQSNNMLTSTLYDLYNNEEWLSNHSNVEDEIFIPAIRVLERKIKNDDVSARLSNMISNTDNMESISDRSTTISFEPQG